MCRPPECAQTIADTFTTKWCTGHEESRLKLLNFALSHDEDTLHFQPEDIAEAIQSCKKRNRFDHKSICLDALEQILFAKPIDFASWLENIAANSVHFADSTVPGLPSGKSSSAPDQNDVRLVLPQPSIMSIFHVLGSKHLCSFLGT